MFESSFFSESSDEVTDLVHVNVLMFFFRFSLRRIWSSIFWCFNFLSFFDDFFLCLLELALLLTKLSVEDELIREEVEFASQSLEQEAVLVTEDKEDDLLDLLESLITEESDDEEFEELDVLREDLLDELLLDEERLVDRLDDMDEERELLLDEAVELASSSS